MSREEEDPAMTDPSTLVGEARRELARLPGVLDVLLAGLAPGGWRARPAPDEWAPVEIVCHLRDEEAEDFGARVRVVLAGGASFAPIDPERWAVERRYRDDDPGAALAAFRQRRAESVALLETAPVEALSPLGYQPVGPVPLRPRHRRGVGHARPAAPPAAGRHPGPSLGRALDTAAE